MRRSFVILLVISLLATEWVAAQSFYARKRDRKFIASVGTGVTSYFGELNNPGDFLDTKLNLNFGLQYKIGYRFGVRAEITWYQLSGTDEEADDPGRTTRNLSFVSNNYEVNVSGIAKLFPEGERFYQRQRFNVYAFYGVGFTFFNPRAELDGQKYSLAPLMTEGVKYSRVTTVLPIGGGIQLTVNPFFNVSLEGGLRKVFTDYLDDVSTEYVNNADFSDPIAQSLADRRPELGLPVMAEGSKRGNPDKKDAYFIANIKIEYYIPSGILPFGQNKYRKPGKPKKRKSRRLRF